MQIYQGTSTLNGLIDDLTFTPDQAEAEMLLIGGKKIDLDAYPKLKGIFKTGVGTDNLPFDEAKERGIEIALPSDATRSVIFEETANFACHLVVCMLYTNVGHFPTWQKTSRGFLGNKRLLVIGTGKIGGQVAKKMEAFVDVDTFDALHNQPEELEPKMRAADAISLHLPLLPATTGWLNAEKLSWLKDGAAVINTARGPVIDEDALYDELATERLKAAIDVFWKEPYEGKLLEIEGDHLKLTPHIASTCQEFLTGTADDFRTFIQKLS